MRLVRNAYTFQEPQRHLLRVFSRKTTDPSRRQSAVLEDRQMRIEIEVLKHHADVLADSIDAAPVVRGELDPVDDDPALLMLLEVVDGSGSWSTFPIRTDRRQLPLTLFHRQVNIVQHMYRAEPFVDVTELDAYIRATVGPQIADLSHVQSPAFLITF